MNKNINHVVKYDYSDGVKLKKPIFWCGKTGFTGWYFTGAQHVALANNSAIEPCQDCVRAIIANLEGALSS